MTVPLLLHGFFHPDGVNYHIKMFQNFWFLPINEVLYSLVGQQFGKVALISASACAMLMVPLETISSTAFSWRAGYMLQRMRITSGVHCWSCSNAMACGTMPSSKFRRRLIEFK
jgi:hypothetical protein